MSDYHDSNMYQSIKAEFVNSDEIEIRSREIDQLTKIIKTETYNSISEEAKEVISLILNTPSEMMELIATPKGLKSKNLIIKYLQKKWRSNFLVNSVIKEITEFVDSL